MSKRPAKIAIAVVSHDVVPFWFAIDLAAMCAYTVARIPDDVEFGVNGVTSTYVHTGRQEMLESLAAADVTHVLWLDSDMRFPRDVFFRLYEHRVQVVGANYSTRGIPPRYVAIKKVGNDDERGHKLATTEESTGIEEVDALGFGCVLMRMDVVRHLPEDAPWFFYKWFPKRREQMGEDVYFCSLLREAGVQIYVDHDVSKLVKHIGQFEYEIGMVAAAREVD